MTDINREPQPHDGSHLTTDQAKYLETYMAAVLARLDLGYWRVHVATDLAPEDCQAMIEATDGRRIAMLYVSDNFWDGDEDHRVIITHEALHLAHHDMDEFIRRFFNESGDISDYVRHLVVGQFKTETERMVDSLSYVLAPHMPVWDPPTDV